ncbi:MAG: hypothetical protein NTU44_08790 [Bacteroidetes bacterium]|nr:hypothetical protein [Bacteroidota bacterium]
MRFRFVFTADGYTQGMGMAIDDFKVIIPYHKDAGVDYVYTPGPIADAGSNLAVEVRLNNFGMDPLSSTDVSYQINNDPPVTETWNGNLAAGDSIHFAFNTHFICPEGTYKLKSYTSYPDDGDHMNDTVRANMFGIPIREVPLFDDFDSTVSFFYTTSTLCLAGYLITQPSNTSILPSSTLQ